MADFRTGLGNPFQEEGSIVPTNFSNVVEFDMLPVPRDPEHADGEWTGVYSVYGGMGNVHYGPCSIVQEYQVEISLNGEAEGG